MMSVENPKPPGPSVKDWALLAISLIFVVLGVIIARDKPREALFPLLFFGVCAVVFIAVIARKIRRRRFAATTVSVAGGVKLQGSNGRALVLAALIGVPGVAIFLTPGAPALILGCGAVMLGGSAMLIVLMVSGRISRRFLRFDPLGLTIGETWGEYVIPWDQITGLTEFEMHDNAVVGFDVLDARAILVTPEAARPRVLKALARSQAFVNRHVMIMPMHFGAHAESLCAAIRNYVENPGARIELVPRLALNAPVPPR